MWDQYGNEIGSMTSVLAQRAVEVNDYNLVARSAWDQRLNDKKAQQAFDKLEELGFYHDSGLYGWLPKKEGM